MIYGATMTELRRTRYSSRSAACTEEVKNTCKGTYTSQAICCSVAVGEQGGLWREEGRPVCVPVTTCRLQWGLQKRSPAHDARRRSSSRVEAVSW